MNIGVIIVSSFMFGVIITSFLFLCLKENKKQHKENNLEHCLIEYSIKPLDLKKRLAISEKKIITWMEKYRTEKPNEDSFMTFVLLLPIFFSHSKLFTNFYWLIYVSEYSYEEGWYDIKLIKRKCETINIRLHYF